MYNATSLRLMTIQLSQIPCGRAAAGQCLSRSGSFRTPGEYAGGAVFETYPPWVPRLDEDWMRPVRRNRKVFGAKEFG
jgi:hypothetical protein